MRKRINILFTSAGRRVELIRNFRKAYKQLDLKGNIVAIDNDPLAPALQVSDRFYIVPKLTSPQYLTTILEICQQEKIQMIFPLIDPDIFVLAQHRQVLEARGARVVVISKERAKMTADKWLTYQFFRHFNIPTPNSWLAREARKTNLDYPVFIKPRFGSAGKKTFKVCNEKELSFFLYYVPNPIIQEYLAGPEITNDVICDFDGNILSVVSRKRIEVRWGEVAKGITIYDSSIIDNCVRVAKKLKAIGPITVQCIFKDGVPHFTEINARFGGGVPLGIAAGVESPRWLLAKAAGIEVKIPHLGSYKVGLTLTRFDDSFFLSKEDIEKIESRRF